MPRHTLENDTIKIEIDAHGAELKSLVKKDSGQEYMWCADAKYWGRTAPVLFPFVGLVKDKKFRAKGQEYEMGQHGFARDMDFELVEASDNAIWYTLNSNEQTLAKYPYEFKLSLGYELTADGVKVIWRVENPGSETLPFSIGGHPAFNCGLNSEIDRDSCYVLFHDTDKVISHRIENGLSVDATDEYELEDGCLAITAHTFDKDALVIENQNISAVSLCGPDKQPYLTVEMDVPLFGVWSPVGQDAPFVCIEPWYGRCDSADFTGDVTEREYGNSIEPGELWERSFVVKVR